MGAATDEPLATRKPSSRSVYRWLGHAAATPSPRIDRLQSGVAGGFRLEGFPSPSLECTQITCLTLAGNDIGNLGLTPELEAAAKMMIPLWKASLIAALIDAFSRLYPNDIEIMSTPCSTAHLIAYKEKLYHWNLLLLLGSDDTYV